MTTVKPFLLTLEYPPQLGGVAKHLEGEVKASPWPAVVSHVRGKRWMNLIWSERKKFAGCDWLWISHVLPIGYIALAWKWVYKTPYRVYLHGLDLVRPRQSKWKTFWVKIILKNADEIIANSRATAQLLNYYGIDAKRARVQYPRIEKINIEQYKPLAEKLRQKYNIGNKPILLTVSRLVKRKGIDLVIKALPPVWQKIPDLVYVVAGEGNYKNYLLDIVARTTEPPPGPLLYSGGGVLFVGAVPDEEKYAWLSACNCFILTPIDDLNDFEGYGIVYKEAQMFGQPVIGSRVGGVPEAVGDGGVLVVAGNIGQIAEAILNASLSLEGRGILHAKP